MWLRQIRRMRVTADIADRRPTPASTPGRTERFSVNIISRVRWFSASTSSVPIALLPGTRTVRPVSSFVSLGVALRDLTGAMSAPRIADIALHLMLPK